MVIIYKNKILDRLFNSSDCFLSFFEKAKSPHAKNSVFPRQNLMGFFIEGGNAVTNGELCC